ncbi:hypothetical protein [Streptomyces sp. B6B3]|uniref:hypothetical protein n=1 Tax=Streptomyces sp. B6B3 TaxID=3153570 RepID=UPI00325D552D
MGTEGESTETPATLRVRAEGLRECARQARELVSSLGPRRVDRRPAEPPAAWWGREPEQPVPLLGDPPSVLDLMAGTLLSDAGRWEAEASALDLRAGGAEHRG